jgi:outer membrane lipopolysaccharide assembly protein LptE/RlpB
MSKKTYGLIAAFLMALSISGCNFHLRSWHQWPDQLSTLKFSDDVLTYDTQSTLRLFLKSMHVNLTDNAPYTFKVSDYTYHQTQPSSSNSSIPSEVTFYLSMQLSILNKDGSTCIAPFTVSSDFSELEPKTTSVVRVSDPDLKMRLLNNATQKIYAKLTSNDVLSKLNAPQCHKITKGK